MTLYRTILIITACYLVSACAVVEPGGSRAIRDEQRVLGMVLVEHEEKMLLKMIVCDAQNMALLEGGVLADESICPNAFVDTEGNDYYFSELEPQGVKQRLFTRGYLKLGSILLIPIAIGTVVGWRAKPLLKRLKLIITSEGKPHLDRGARNTEAVKEAKRLQEEALAKVSTNTKVGAAAGLIMAIVARYNLNDHLWGKGERLTVSHWDNIFRTHVSFADAKLLDNNHSITHILNTIAAALDIEVNPALQPQTALEK